LVTVWTTLQSDKCCRKEMRSTVVSNEMTSRPVVFTRALREDLR